jgi:hypothetical protein
MTTKIIAVLKAAQPKVTPIAFGEASMPKAPYVVVKMESMAGKTTFRVIGHFSAGQELDLEDYMRGNVESALDYLIVADRHGNTNQLRYLEGTQTGVLPVSSDSTISMERVYWMPSFD